MTLTRPQVPATPRKGFTMAERARAFLAAQGRCALCGVKIIGAFQIDHIIELALGGKHEPSNWRVLDIACHRGRTSERAPVLAKVKRIIARENGTRRERQAIASNPKIQSRPFPKSPTHKRTMAGKVVLREDGR